MAKPKFELQAADKSTKGKFLKIGAIWESNIPGLMNLTLEDGVSITVNRAYDKVARSVVDIKPEVITTGKGQDGSHYLNIKPPYQPQEMSDLEKSARTTFNVGDFNEKFE